MLRWKPPFQSTKTRIVPVQGYPLAAGFHCQRRVPSIGYEVAASISLATQTREDRPVLRSGLDEETVRLGHQHLTKFDDFSQTARPGENFGVGCDSHDPTQHLWRHAVP